jgi:peroxiredoxin
VARTESAMIELGTEAPAFALEDVVTTRHISIDQVRGERGLLVMFICRHCPFVKHVEKELAALGTEFPNKGVGVVAISSNDADCYSEDSPPALRMQAGELGFTFPYLFDETQEVAHAYNATCTPDFFLFDKDLKLTYRGQLDDSRPGNGVPVTGKDLRGALNALLAGQPISAEQRPSLGCSIKWRHS